MRLHADFTQRVVVHASAIPWTPSPMPGVDRRMLDRVGEEVARATSIVRYAPGSAFSAHTHTGGEEFLVLEGVFQDEHGDFPAGSYVRNPPGTSHTPGSAPGVTIFVKLWQFQPGDTHPVSLRPQDIELRGDPQRPGVRSAVLHRDPWERVRLEQWEAHAEVVIPQHDGLEILVLQGSFKEGADTLVERSWLRLPPGQALRARAGQGGARVWLKQDHLKHVRIP